MVESEKVFSPLFKSLFGGITFLKRRFRMDFTHFELVAIVVQRGTGKHPVRSEDVEAARRYLSCVSAALPPKVCKTSCIPWSGTRSGFFYCVPGTFPIRCSGAVVVTKSLKMETAAGCPEASTVFCYQGTSTLTSFNLLMTIKVVSCYWIEK